MFRTISKHIAPAGMPAPVLWGDEAIVRDRLKSGIADLKLERRVYHFEYPFPPDAVVEFYRTNYGPVSRAFASFDVHGQEKLRAELVGLWSALNKGTGDCTKVDAEYLEVIATHDSTVLDPPNTSDAYEHRGFLGARASRLADRIEEGAAALAVFAEGVSEAEWRTPVSDSYRRSIGAIVHHVASVYPIEIDLARTIASGKAITDVTWNVVAELNAKHAQEQTGVAKPAAIELLRRNSHDAANAVRTFSDEELDRAAPCSLAFGAPITAQFLIEDHALRHSWHHLAACTRHWGAEACANSVVPVSNRSA